MSKLFKTVRKVYLMIILCAIFIGASSMAAMALAYESTYEWEDSYIQKTLSGKVTDINGEPL